MTSFNSTLRGVSTSHSTSLSTTGYGILPTATVTVAASNATTAIKNAADYVTDGVSDEVEINAAIASLPSTGGTCVLSEGTYNISSPIVFQKDNSGFYGYARGTTIIQPSVGFTGSSYMTFNRTDLAGAGNRPCDKIDVGFFTIDGLWQGTQSTTDGIKFCARSSYLHNVDIGRCNGTGLRVRGVPSAERGNAGDATTYEATIVDCRIHENGNGGVNFDTMCGDSRIRDCDIFQNAGPGIYNINPIAWIRSCYVWGNMDQSVAGGSALGKGIQLAGGSSRINIFGNKIEQNRGGLRLDSASELTIYGNEFASNSTALTNATSSGTMPSGYFLAPAGGSSGVTSDIEIANTGVSGATIIGNQFSPQTYTSDRSAYIFSFSAGNNVIFRLNNINGTGVSGLVNWAVGGGNVFSIGQNTGYITDASGTATITAAATSVTVTHGLAFAPAAGDIKLVLTNQPTNALGNIWVSSIGATTFTINVANAPGANTAIFGWSASTHRFS